MAYTAVTSLKHTIARNKLLFTDVKNRQLLSLSNTLKALDDQRDVKIDAIAINDLEGKIREAACKLEDAIESYLLYSPVDWECLNQERISFFTTVKELREELREELARVLCIPWPPDQEDGDGDGDGDVDDDAGGHETVLNQEIISFFTTVKELREEYERVLRSPLPPDQEDGDGDGDAGGQETVATVEISDLFERIKAELLDSQPGPKIVSLVGMAGIGKTHLARRIYEHPTIVQHFEFRVWVRVGRHDRDLRNVFRNIVAQVEGRPINLYMKKDMYALNVDLHRSLNDGKYLIVLDDVWSTKVSDYLERWIPSTGVGRRILLTTRREKVSKHRSTSSHQMPFLNNKESWNLLGQIVFGDISSVPRQLEEAGKKIAEKCEGLPLLIIAVAKLLRMDDNKTEEYWNKVAEKKTTTFTEAYDQILKVLISSYEYLPQNLKACLLYMGVFPQSFEIPLPKLLQLWVVEDFLEHNKYFECPDYGDPFMTLEVKVMECLKELVSDNLVIVCKHSSTFIIKSCKLHSAYWHMCVKEARKNKFFHVMKNLKDGSKDIIEGQRRLSVQNNILFGIKEVYDSMAATSTARSLLCTGPDHQYPVPVCCNLMLLKVLDALTIRFYEFPSEILNLVQLKYLALTHNGEVPSSISKLQKLRCLILRQHHNIKLLSGSTYLPQEIWDLRELMHLRIMGSNLPDPNNKNARLRCLLTLHVNARSCTENVFKNINHKVRSWGGMRTSHHLRKLGIKIELQPDAAEILSCFEHVGTLDSLTSLKCVVVNPRLKSRVVAPPDHLLNLPRTLKKLSLNGLGYSWKNISIIGSLPKLEVLKLHCSAFQGSKWESKVKESKSLEVLLLEDIDLVHWTIDDTNCFPRLRCLILQHCYKLKGLPIIQSLKTLEVVDCNPSVVASAQAMQQINPSLQVGITSSWTLPS